MTVEKARLQTGTTAVQAMFATAREQNRAAFLPYFPIGYPDTATSLDAIQAMAEESVDGFEIGMPFSDPLADGPRGMSTLVGFVLQDPESQFVVDSVEDELAFAMENHNLEQAIMRKRVEEVLDQLNIAHLRHRRINTLSGGEKQRVAIGAVLTLEPKVLVLDEPTSQLDPQAAEEVLTTLQKLNADLGLTIILSEHRLERVVQFVTGMANIRDVIPFPRTPGNAEF